MAYPLSLTRPSNPADVAGSESASFSYDVVCDLHDPVKEQALNVRLLTNDFSPIAPPYQFAKGIMTHKAGQSGTDYVLTHRVNGQLVKAHFTQINQSFGYCPRITAEGTNPFDHAFFTIFE